MQLNKRLVWIGHITMLLLLLFSILFYRERMLHTDNAYSTFLLVNTASFNLPHYRYPLILTQLLPLLAVKLQWSLKTIIALYSANFYVLYYGCFLIALYAYKNILASWAILLSLLVCTSEIFFLQTEILHGIVFGITFYAWLHYHLTNENKITIIHYGVGALLFLIAVTFHPLSALFLLFLMLWTALDVKQQNKNITIPLIVFGLTILVIVIKSILTPANSYEGSFYPSSSSLWSNIIHIIDSYVLKFFVKRLNSLYLLPSIMLIVSLIWYAYNKMKLHFGLLMLSALGYILFVSIFFKGDSTIMTERIFLVYGAIVSVGFVTALIDFSKNYLNKTTPNLITLLLVASISAGIIKILEAQRTYNLRLELVKAQAMQAQSKNGTKFYAYTSDFNFPFAMWANACEQLLYSGMYFPDKVKTIYLFNDESDAQKQIAQMDENSFLLVPFYLQLPDTFLNQKYFKLKSNNYHYLN